MAPRKRLRPKSDFGSKVAHLLTQRRTRGQKPSSNVELAKMVGVSPSAVDKWVTRGSSPGTSTLHAVAVVLTVDPEWLSNDAKKWPPPDAATAFSAVWKLIPSGEQKPLEMLLADPVERRAAIASYLARLGVSQ